MSNEVRPNRVLGVARRKRTRVGHRVICAGMRSEVLAGRGRNTPKRGAQLCCGALGLSERRRNRDSSDGQTSERATSKYTQSSVSHTNARYLHFVTP